MFKSCEIFCFSSGNSRYVQIVLWFVEPIHNCQAILSWNMIQVKQKIQDFSSELNSGLAVKFQELSTIHLNLKVLIIFLDLKTFAWFFQWLKDVSFKNARYTEKNVFVVLEMTELSRLRTGNGWCGVFRVLETMCWDFESNWKRIAEICSKFRVRVGLFCLKIHSKEKVTDVDLMYPNRLPDFPTKKN